MVYYVTHPNLGITALIHAPATEKARTTFLDYLERQGQISRADRQHWRRNMIAEKMEDPYDVTADVELYYGYEESGSGPVMPSERQGYYDRDKISPSGGRMVEIPAERESEIEREEVEESLPISIGRSRRGIEQEIAEEEAAGVYEGEPQQPARKTIQEVAKEDPRSQKSLSPIARKALEGYVK